jgi:hypothetical protein
MLALLRVAGALKRCARFVAVMQGGVIVGCTDRGCIVNIQHGACNPATAINQRAGCR